MKGKLTRKVLAFLLTLAMVVTYMPAFAMTAFAEEGNVAKIGDQEYATLDEAISAAEKNNKIEILKGGEYAVNTLSVPDGVTIDATGVDNVVFKHTSAATSWVVGNPDCRTTAKNITFDVGQAAHQYFSNIVCENCTIKGLICTHTYNLFKNCKFINEDGYNMWAYGNDVTCEDCEFTCSGSNGGAINVYNEGDQGGIVGNVVLKNCKFTAKTSTDRYAAVYIKPEHKFNVEFEGCTANDNFCVGKFSGNRLWNLKADREGTTVLEDGNQVYPKQTVVVDGDKTATVTTSQDSKVDVSGLPITVANDVKTAMENQSVVTGVALITSTDSDKLSGLQQIVNKAQKNAGDKKVEAVKNAEEIAVDVTVKVKPVEYTPSEEGVKSGTVKFELNPVAKVTAVNGETETVIAENVPVTNDMIDQDKPISVKIYTGFKPKQIVHVDDAGNIIEVFNGDEINYDSKAGTATVAVAHFSSLLATEKSYVAQVTDKDGNLIGGDNGKYEKLDDAIAAISDTDGGIITLLNSIDNGQQSGFNFNYKKFVLDLNGNNVTGSSIFNAGNSAELTIKNSKNTGGNVRSISGHIVKAKNATVIIAGGNYSILQKDGFGVAEKNGEIKFIGGTFNFNPESAIADDIILLISKGSFTIPTNYEVIDNQNDTWTVKKNIGDNVAEIGNTMYKTLQAAIAASKSGDTITLLTDLTDVGALTLHAGVTLDGTGKKLSGESSIGIHVNGGTVKNVVFDNIHNVENELSAIYGSGLSGNAVVTGCTFNGWDWDAIQITPVAGATVSITSNTFNAKEGPNVKRAVHVESTTPYTGIDFSANVTGNKFIDCNKLSKNALEVYYVKEENKLVASGNYIDNGSVYLGTGNSMNNAFAKALPLMDETLTNELDIVAHCGTKFYTDFNQAFDAMNSAKGATITLFKDIEIDSTKVIGIPEMQYCKINLNGHKITGGNSRVFHVKSGILELNGSGTISSNPAQSSSVIRVGDNNATINSQLTIYSGVTVSTETAYAVTAFGSKTETVKVCGTVISTAPANNAYDGSAISTNGLDTTPAKITISAGAKVSAANTNAIYLPSGELTVQGDKTTVTGTTGIYVKGGTATIQGGTITGNGAIKAYEYYGNGGISTGDALVIDNCGYPTEIDNISITGGTFNSTNGGVQIGAYFGNTKTEIATITSTINNLSAPEDYAWKETETSGTYKLTKCNYVAQIGNDKYETLADAVAAVPTDGNETTITMIADVDYGNLDNQGTGATIGINKNVVLDLNGHIIKGTKTNDSKNVYIIKNTGILTVVDNSDGSGGMILLDQDMTEWNYQTDSVAIENHGALTVESGTIKATRKSTGMIYAIDNRVAWEGSVPSLIINGGTIESDYAAIRDYAQYNEKGTEDITTLVNGGTINAAYAFFLQDGADSVNKINVDINGGTFNSTSDMFYFGLCSENVAKITIEGENISSFNGRSVAAYDYDDNAKNNVDFKIKSGKYSFPNDSFVLVRNSESTEHEFGIAISGGYYTDDVADFVADGYECIDTPTTDPNYTDYPYMIGVKKVDNKINENAEKTSQTDSEKAAEKQLGHTPTEEEKIAIAGAIDNAINNIGLNTNTEDYTTNGKEKVDTNSLVKNHQKPGLDEDQKLYGKYENHDTTVVVELEKVEVTAVKEATQSLEFTIGKAVYEVTPKATVTTTIKDGEETRTETKTVILTNDDLKDLGAVTVRFAVPQTNAKQAKVTHRSEDKNYPVEVFYTDVKGEGTNQYVEIKMTHFSEVTIETIDLAEETVAFIVRNGEYIEFNDLQNALDSAATANETVYLAKPIETAGFTVPADVTLDLNGKTVAPIEEVPAIVNYGTIKVYQCNANVAGFLLYHVPGNYITGEEMVVPETAETSICSVPKDVNITSSVLPGKDSGEKGSAQYLKFDNKGKGAIEWNADIRPKTQLTITGDLLLDADILPSTLDAQSITLNKNTTVKVEGTVTLKKDIEVGKNFDPSTTKTSNPAGMAILEAKNINFNKHKITINKDESGYEGKVIVKDLNEWDDSGNMNVPTPGCVLNRAISIDPLRIEYTAESRIASVKHDNHTTYYKSLYEASEVAVSGDTITLLANDPTADAGKDILIKEDVIVDFAGNSASVGYLTVFGTIADTSAGSEITANKVLYQHRLNQNTTSSGETGIIPALKADQATATGPMIYILCKAGVISKIECTDNAEVKVHAALNSDSYNYASHLLKNVGIGQGNEMQFGVQLGFTTSKGEGTIDCYFRQSIVNQYLKDDRYDYEVPYMLWAGLPLGATVDENPFIESLDYATRYNGVIRSITVTKKDTGGN